MDFKKIIFICFAIFAFYLWNRVINRKRNYLVKNGTSAVAKVISINKTLVEVGNQYSNARPVMKIVLEIEVAGTAYRQVTIKQAFETWNIPKDGDKVNILIDPSNPDNVMITDTLSDG